jgi:hypothetical protein
LATFDGLPVVFCLAMVEFGCLMCFTLSNKIKTSEQTSEQSVQNDRRKSPATGASDPMEENPWATAASPIGA